MKNRFEKGTIVLWANDGEVITYRSIDEAYEKEHIELSKERFIKALGTDREVKSGVTAFRYGIDKEATEGYDEASYHADALKKVRDALSVKDSYVVKVSGGTLEDRWLGEGNKVVKSIKEAKKFANKEDADKARSVRAWRNIAGGNDTICVVEKIRDAMPYNYVMRRSGNGAYLARGSSILEGIIYEGSSKLSGNAQRFSKIAAEMLVKDLNRKSIELGHKGDWVIQEITANDLGLTDSAFADAQWAPGWDMEGMWRAVKRDEANRNKVNLRIHSQNCDEDMAKLRRNISQLSGGTAEDKAWIPAYEATIRELEKVKKYIEQSSAFRDSAFRDLRVGDVAPKFAVGDKVKIGYDTYEILDVSDFGGECTYRARNLRTRAVHWGADILKSGELVRDSRFRDDGAGELSEHVGKSVKNDGKELAKVLGVTELRHRKLCVYSEFWGKAGEDSD